MFSLFLLLLQSTSLHVGTRHDTFDTVVDHVAPESLFLSYFFLILFSTFFSIT